MKKSVIVVHGVGNQARSETNEAFVQGVLGYYNDDRDYVADPEVKQSSWVLSESKAPGNSRIETFVSDVRRFSIDKTNVVSAEVYWADLSKVSAGMVGLLRALFDLLYGLPIVIREAIDRTVNNPDEQGNQTLNDYQRLCSFISWCFIGPIFAFYILVAATLWIHVGIYYFKVAILKIAFFVFGATVIIDSLSWLDDVLMLAISVALLFKVHLLRHWFESQHWSLDTIKSLFYFLGIGSVLLAIHVVSDISGSAFVAAAEAMSSISAWLWVVPSALALLAAIAVTAFERAHRRGSSNAVKSINGIGLSIVLIVLSIALWAVLLASVFSLMVKLLPEAYVAYAMSLQLDFQLILETSTRWLMFSVIGIVLLALIFGFAALRRTKWVKQRQPFTSMQVKSYDDTIPRLIVPVDLVRVCVAAIFGSVIFIVLDIVGVPLISEFINFLAPIILVFVGFLLYVFGMLSKQLALGIDIGLDVVNYWRRPHERVTKERMPSMLSSARAIFDWAYKIDDWVMRDDVVFKTPVYTKADSDSKWRAVLKVREEIREITDEQGYWKRFRMRVRFLQVLIAIIERESPDEIVVVAHSQGTMIAIDALSEADRLGLLSGLTTPPSLITMGSPYSHLYSHYFPSAHPPNPLTPRMASGSPIVKAWVNIYRADDFVGTFIDDDGLPNKPIRNIRIGPGGHTGYWTDGAVQEIIAREGVIVP